MHLNLFYSFPAIAETDSETEQRKTPGKAQFDFSTSHTSSNEHSIKRIDDSEETESYEVPHSSNNQKSQKG